MSILTIEDLKSRSVRDPVTHCWHWQGAFSAGNPRIWTLDHERIEKRSMSGPKAVWNIAHGKPPMDRLVFRACGCKECVNPAHLKTAKDKAEIGEHIRRAGFRKGTATEARRANALKAIEAMGIVPTAPDVVIAVRAATGTGIAIAAQFGLSHQTVSKIRRGESHKHLLEAA